MTDGAIWGSIEPSVGVICACLPTMLPFAEYIIFKPVRNFTTSLRSILRPSSNKSDEELRSRQKSEDSKKWQRLQGEGPSNYAFARGGTVNAQEEREAEGLDGIGVRKVVDVVGDDKV